MRLVTSKYFLTSALLLCFLSVYAQEKKEAGDSLKRIQKPTGVRIGTDLIAAGKNFLGSPLTGWEVNADVDFGRYYLALDYGSWSRKDSVANGYYTNDGRYFRAGVDVNFLLKDPDKNMVFIGFRYGRSSFNEQLTYDDASIGFGTTQIISSNPKSSGGWGELTTGLRIKIWKSLWMGYTARMKFMPGTKGNSELLTYDMPGYGKTSKSTYWGFNYQVFYRIPFRREK